MEKKKKFLIIRLGAIGDVVHSTVIAQAVKKKYPESEVHFLTQSLITDILKMSPFVDKIYDFDMSKKNNVFYLLKLCCEFRKQKYNVIFRLTNSLRDMVLSTFSFAEAVVKRKKTTLHAVNTFFETANSYFGDLKLPENLELRVLENAENEILEKIKDYPKPYFLFNPGGANDNFRQGRIWSKEKWLELGNRLSTKYGGTIFVCGSKSEKPNHMDFTAIKNAVIFSGELNLVQSSALYKQADVMISGDSGPLHIADALNVNLVALMGSTSPQNCGPFSAKGVVEPTTECRYCGLKHCHHLSEGETNTPCMESVSVDMVEKSVEKYLNNL